MLPRAEMLARMRTRDRTADGLFLTGVVTTGTYCLPSCPARTPNPENAVFFATAAGAVAAGLRALQRGDRGGVSQGARRTGAQPPAASRRYTKRSWRRLGRPCQNSTASGTTR